MATEKSIIDKLSAYLEKTSIEELGMNINDYKLSRGLFSRQMFEDEIEDYGKEPTLYKIRIEGWGHAYISRHQATISNEESKSTLTFYDEKAERLYKQIKEKISSRLKKLLEEEKSEESMEKKKSIEELIKILDLKK